MAKDPFASRTVKAAGRNHVQARKDRGESYGQQNARAVGRILNAAPKPPPNRSR